MGIVFRESKGEL